MTFYVIIFLEGFMCTKNYMFNCYGNCVHEHPYEKIYNIEEGRFNEEKNQKN